MSNAETFKKIISEIKYATIATATKDGKPWNSPVFCAVDDACNIYWSSHLESEHSKNIVANPQAFIVIYNSQAKAGEGQGAYIEATVNVLTSDKEIRAALNLLSERQGKRFSTLEKCSGNGPQRIYKAVPQNLWLNDAEQDEDGDFIKDFRIPVSLD
jgi:nitroimidazol reductase NimA-like FMN-containing flavoprotein (pyridoxamine 5'-phosphate oxidase superfamily)